MMTDLDCRLDRLAKRGIGVRRENRTGTYQVYTRPIVKVIAEFPTLDEATDFGEAFHYAQG